MIPTLLMNYRMLKRALAKKVSQRFGDQYGMLLAGYSVLLQDEPLTAQDAEKLVDHVKLGDEKEESKVTDHDDCLNLLDTKRIRYKDEVTDRDFSVRELIQMARTNDHVNQFLQRIGIKVTLDSVSIATNHNELENQIFRGSRWSQSWSRSLARLPGTLHKSHSTWMAGKNQKSTVLPGTLFWSDTLL